MLYCEQCSRSCVCHEDTKNIGLKKMLNIAEKIEYVTLFVEHCENISWRIFLIYSRIQIYPINYYLYFMSNIAEKA
jgi:hypothetical protein